MEKNAKEGTLLKFCVDENNYLLFQDGQEFLLIKWWIQKNKKVLMVEEVLKKDVTIGQDEALKQ